MEKKKIIESEIQRYKGIFEKIEEEKKPFAEKLYQQAAFMSATLKELQEKIDDEGAVIVSTNGNGFKTTQEHPAQKSYNTMIRNYNATIKSLLDLLPENQNEDELIGFLNE